ncbi:MAG: hypothetical protein GY714_00695 [Desulfobacterales bacterium]|nr:hypothetical protein [Desulfobacterales bacterium]
MVCVVAKFAQQFDIPDRELFKWILKHCVEYSGTYKTENIIEVISSNGWRGFAIYNAAIDEFHGFIELINQPSPMLEDWRGKIFSIIVIRDSHTLNIEGSSQNIKFSATFRMME